MSEDGAEAKKEAPISEEKAFYIDKALLYYGGMREESQTLANKDLNYAQRVRQKTRELTNLVDASQPEEAERETIIVRTRSLVDSLARKLESFEGEGRILAGSDIQDKGELTHLLEEVARETNPEKARKLAEAAIGKFNQVAGQIVDKRGSMTGISSEMIVQAEETGEDADIMTRRLGEQNPNGRKSTLLLEFRDKVSGLEGVLSGREQNDEEFRGAVYLYQENFNKAVQELIKKS